MPMLRGKHQGVETHIHRVPTNGRIRHKIMEYRQTSVFKATKQIKGSES